MVDVVALGELLIDFAPIATDESGYPTFAAKPGGGVCNYLAALTAYGASTAFIGKVGSDTFGALLIKTLSDMGIEIRGIIQDPSVFTTLAFVTLDSLGDREFSFSRKPGADTCLTFEEVDLRLIADAKIFHFSTVSLTNNPAREATQKAVEYAKKNGKLITFDPNLRCSLWDDLSEAAEHILWGLKQADIVKISSEEIEFLWGCSNEEAGIKLIYEFGVRLAMLTLGMDGSVLINKNAAAKAACPPVKAVDTTGAGDIFGGSAVSRFLKYGKSPEELTQLELAAIAEFATVAASLSTQILGGIPSIPAIEEVNKIAR